MWSIITEAGDIYFGLLVVALILWSGKRRAGIGLTLLLLVDLFFNTGLKALFRMPRPPGVQGLAYSFPSGHTQRISALTTYLHEPWFLILILLVAYSRIALGVHYWQDVIAGLAIGLLEGHLIRRAWGKAPLELEKRASPYLFGIGIAFSLVGLGLAMAGFPFTYMVGSLVGLSTGLTLRERVHEMRASNLLVGFAGFVPLLYLAYTSTGLLAYLSNYLLGLWISYLGIRAMNILNSRSA